MTSGGHNHSRGSLEPGKDKIEEVAKVLSTFTFIFYVMLCLYVVVLQPKYQQVPEQSAEPSRTDEVIFFGHKKCQKWVLKNALVFRPLPICQGCY